MMVLQNVSPYPVVVCGVTNTFLLAPNETSNPPRWQVGTKVVLVGPNEGNTCRPVCHDPSLGGAIRCGNKDFWEPPGLDLAAARLFGALGAVPAGRGMWGKAATKAELEVALGKLNLPPEHRPAFEAAAREGYEQECVRRTGSTAPGLIPDRAEPSRAMTPARKLSAADLARFSSLLRKDFDKRYGAHLAFLLPDIQDALLSRMVIDMAGMWDNGDEIAASSVHDLYVMAKTLIFGVR